MKVRGEVLTGTRVSITPRYSDEDVIGLDEWSLLLEYWDGSGGMWVDGACGRACASDAGADRSIIRNDIVAHT